MADSSLQSPQNGPANYRSATLMLLQTWFGVRYEVSRTMYALTGIGLIFFKYFAEFIVISHFTGESMMPWEFVNPVLNWRAEWLAQGPEWLGWALFAWNLPFVWIAFSMSVRRAADAGLSPWTGMLVLVPLLNLFAMVGLALMPRSQKPHWTPQSADQSTRQPVADHRHTLLAIGVGLLIGVSMLGLSISVANLYGATLFFATPLMMGAFAGFILNRPHPHSWKRTMSVASLLMLAAGGALIVFALEGVICLLMAAPLVFPLGLIGGALGKAIADSTETSIKHTLLVLFALPVLTGVEAVHHPAPEYVVLTTVDVNASPETVWEFVVEFPDLPVAKEWFFRVGIACPLRARIDGQGVGAVRYCDFTTGTFVEPITTWDEPRQLAFDVAQQPDPMRELSPYRHVHPPHLENDALRSHRGEFRLIPLSGNRTRLEGRTWYTFQMFPQAYWTLWSDMSIHRIHTRVLKHIKQLAEADRT